MNIVVLCKRHNHRKALEILSALYAEGLEARGIVALAPAPARRSFKEIVQKIYYRAAAWSWHKKQARRAAFFNTNGKAAHGEALPVNGRVALSRLPRQEESSPVSAKTFAPGSSAPQTLEAFAQAHRIPLVTVADLNGEACVAALRKFETDLLLLGGVPIIRAQVLAVPRVGTLNAHMAWLPGIRGMNVAEWSVYCDAPVAVTVHFVDAGVDTGAALYREPVEVSECRSIAAMRRKMSRQQHLALARAARLCVDGKAPLRPQPNFPGKQYYVMHERLKRAVERKLSRAADPAD